MVTIAMLLWQANLEDYSSAFSDLQGNLCCLGFPQIQVVITTMLVVCFLLLSPYVAFFK